MDNKELVILAGKPAGGGGGGGGGGGEVTPASIVTATGKMSDAQKAQTRTNLNVVSTATMGEVYTRLEKLEAAATSTDVKDALLDCFAHVAWTDEHGQEYYGALEAALYPPADLVSISAVYTQSGTVYATDSLDSLKSDLVVTALYVDTTTATITNYTLSGTLAVGTSTITVNYGGKTTTFDVMVSAPAFLYELSESDFSRGLANSVNYGSTPPYTQVNAKRISYVDFDLLFDGGKTYEIIATSTKDTANMGIQFFNAALLDDVANHNNIGTANTFDDGWQNLSVTIAVPATHNNSAIKGCRITFRESSANPNISSNFKITKLTIREVTV